MDDFLVVYEVQDRKKFWVVVAKNTLHAKDIILEQHPYDVVNFIDVDFAPSDLVKKKC